MMLDFDTDYDSGLHYNFKICVCVFVCFSVCVYV